MDLEGKGGNGRDQRANGARETDDEVAWRRTFAANLRDARDQLRFSQTELAERAGVKQNTVSDLERAAINPSFGVIVRLARAVGVSPPALLNPRGDLAHGAVRAARQGS